MGTKTVLITGATGNQGGAVARAALARGMGVRALVRKPDSEAARQLEAQGAELVTGDLADAESLQRAAAGMDAAFVVTTPFAPGMGLEAEMKLGRQVIDALAGTDLPHLVYSSVSDADRNTGVGHFDTKWDAEQYLADKGVAATVTAPVFFSDNVLFPWNLADLRAGRFRQALPADRALQVVSLGEIGRFNAVVLERGAQLAGRRINYASDELTPAQMTAALAAASGRDLTFEQQPLQEMAAMGGDMADMYRWFDEVGYSADAAALREEFPEVEWQSFSQWAGGLDWSSLLAAPKD